MTERDPLQAAFAACERFLDATEDMKAAAGLALNQALATLTPVWADHVLEHFCDETTGEPLIAFDSEEVHTLRGNLERQRFEQIEGVSGTDPILAAEIAVYAHPIRDLLDEFNAQYPAAEKDEIALQAARQQTTRTIPAEVDLTGLRNAALGRLHILADGDDGISTRADLEMIATLKAVEQQAARAQRQRRQAHRSSTAEDRDNQP